MRLVRFKLIILSIVFTVGTPNAAFSNSPFTCNSIFTSSVDQKNLSQVIRQIWHREANALRINPGVPGVNTFEAIQNLYRGISQENYGRHALISFLRGDRKFELRSWSYSRILNSRIDANIPIPEALKQTDKEIEKIVIEGLSGDWKNYTLKEAHKTLTNIPIEQKNSTAISFSFRLETAINYGIATRRNFTAEQAGKIPLIIIDIVKTEKSLPHLGSEAQVFSHVTSSEVNGAFYGTPKQGLQEWKNESHFDWTYLRIENSADTGAGQATQLVEYQVVVKNILLPASGGVRYQLELGPLITNKPQ